MDENKAGTGSNGSPIPSGRYEKILIITGVAIAILVSNSHDPGLWGHFALVLYLALLGRIVEGPLFPSFSIPTFSVRHLQMK